MKSVAKVTNRLFLRNFMAMGTSPGWLNYEGITEA